MLNDLQIGMKESKLYKIADGVDGLFSQFVICQQDIIWTKRFIFLYFFSKASAAEDFFGRLDH